MRECGPPDGDEDRMVVVADITPDGELVNLDWQPRGGRMTECLAMKHIDMSLPAPPDDVGEGLLPYFFEVQ